jgi:aminopeptidase N
MDLAQPAEIRRADYRAPGYLIERVELEFDLEPMATRVMARLRVRRNHDAAAGAGPLLLHGDGLRLTGIALDGRALPADAYAADEQGLTLHRPPAGAFTLEIGTTINPAANTALSGLYLSSNVFCTQCEAEGFRRITYFLDRPDVMATYRTTIRAPREGCPVLLSNGNLVEEGALPDGRHFAVWDDPFPKPSYLFALVAGDLAVNEDSFTTRAGRKVRLRIFVEHG